MAPAEERQRQSRAHQEALSPTEPSESQREEAPPPESNETQQEETTESSDVLLDVRKYEAHFIQRRKSDGFMNATSMATACGKFWGHYAATQRAKDYIKALSDALSIIGNPIIESGLIDCRQGGAHTGTWIHPRLAIDFARWLNPKFAVWMDGWFLESVSLLPPQQQQETPPRAPPRIHDAPSGTRGTGNVRPDLYIGVAPNLNVIKIGNTNNLAKRQNQHRAKPRDDAAFHDKDYRHIFCSRGYGHLDQLLLTMHSERRINNSDQLRGAEIDLDAVVEALPELQERWELANPVQDDEHARGLKRRRDESDVLLHEARNAADATKAQADAAKAQAEANVIKAVTDSIVADNLEAAREKLEIFEQLYGKRP